MPEGSGIGVTGVGGVPSPQSIVAVWLLAGGARIGSRNQATSWSVTACPSVAVKETGLTSRRPKAPILLAEDSVNQSLPSGPVVMPVGPLEAVGIRTR